MSEYKYLRELDGGREDLALAVASGARLLDQARPGWEDYARLPDERQPSDNGCMLCYLWGVPHYGTAAALWLDDNPHYQIPRLTGREDLGDCHEWGFAVPPGAPLKNTWRRLVRLWRGLIEYRADES